MQLRTKTYSRVISVIQALVLRAVGLPTSPTLVPVPSYLINAMDFQRRAGLFMGEEAAEQLRRLFVLLDLDPLMVPTKEQSELTGFPIQTAKQDIRSVAS